MKRIIMILVVILVSSFVINDKLVSPSTYVYEGCFLYEYSEESRSIDDMIFRKRGIVHQINEKPIYAVGLFRFEENKNNEIKELYGEKERLDYYSNFFSDSIHNYLDNYPARIIDYNGIKFKSLQLRIEVIPIGIQKVFVNEGKDAGMRLIPNFMVKKINIR